MREKWYINDILDRAGAVRRNGHFVLTDMGGKQLHTDTFVSAAALGCYPVLADKLADQFVRLLWSDIIHQVEVVVTAATSGIAWGSAVARALADRHNGNPTAVAGVFAEKVTNGTAGFSFRRGFAEKVRSHHILVLGDVVNTGDSTAKLVTAVREAGGIIVAGGVLWNRAGITSEQLGLEPTPPLISLVDEELPSWPAARCRLCERNIPLSTDFGHGDQVVARAARAAANERDGLMGDGVWPSS